tara:strand:+ start:1055 stop:1468 length:414 start_codon:yes stop_codon:yes gene_type:complete
MSSNFYSVGLNHVGAYQVSGTPHISHITLTTDANHSDRIQFPTVTKNIIVRSNDTVDIRIHFAPFTGSYGYTDNASTSNNFIILEGAGQVELDAKCKEIFISAPSAVGTEVVQVYAELTNIPRERMFSLDGVDGVSS